MSQERKTLKQVYHHLANSGCIPSLKKVTDLYLSLKTSRYAVLNAGDGCRLREASLRIAELFGGVRYFDQVIYPRPQNTEECLFHPYRTAVLRHNCLTLTSDYERILDTSEGEIDGFPIAIIYGDGMMESSMVNKGMGKTGDPFIQIHFRGGIQSWIREQFQIGDYFLLRAVESEEDNSQVLRLEKFKTEPQVHRRRKIRANVVDAWEWNVASPLGNYDSVRKTFETSSIGWSLMQARAEPDRPFFLIIQNAENIEAKNLLYSLMSSQVEADSSFIRWTTKVTSETDMLLNDSDNFYIPVEIPVPENLFFLFLHEGHMDILPEWMKKLGNSYSLLHSDKYKLSFGVKEISDWEQGMSLELMHSKPVLSSYLSIEKQNSLKDKGVYDEFIRSMGIVDDLSRLLKDFGMILEINDFDMGCKVLLESYRVDDPEYLVNDALDGWMVNNIVSRLGKTDYIRRLIYRLLRLIIQPNFNIEEIFPVDGKIRYNFRYVFNSNNFIFPRFAMELIGILGETYHKKS